MHLKWIRMQNKISIVIPAYNEERLIEKCLDSLHDQVYKKFEVIVVDNNSKDRTVQVVRDYKKRMARAVDIKLLECKKPGAAAPRNMGWRNSSAPFVFFLDADEILPKDFLKELIPYLKDGRTIYAPRRTSKATNLISRVRLCQNVPLDVYGIGGIPRIFPRQVLVKLGGYNEDLEYNEDYDIRVRAVKSDYKIKDVQLLFYHLEPDTMKDFIAQASWTGKGYIYNIGKYPIKTIIFYGMHFLHLLPVFSFICYVAYLLFRNNLAGEAALVMIAVWVFYHAINIARLYRYSNSSAVLAVPFFDIIKGITVYISLLFRVRL